MPQEVNFASRYMAPGYSNVPTINEAFLLLDFLLGSSQPVVTPSPEDQACFLKPVKSGKSSSNILNIDFDLLRLRRDALRCPVLDDHLSELDPLDLLKHIRFSEDHKYTRQTSQIVKVRILNAYNVTDTTQKVSTISVGSFVSSNDFQVSGEGYLVTTAYVGNVCADTVDSSWFLGKVVSSTSSFDYELQLFVLDSYSEPLLRSGLSVLHWLYASSGNTSSTKTIIGLMGGQNISIREWWRDSRTINVPLAFYGESGTESIVPRYGDCNLEYHEEAAENLPEPFYSDEYHWRYGTPYFPELNPCWVEFEASFSNIPSYSCACDLAKRVFESILALLDHDVYPILIFNAVFTEDSGLDPEQIVYVYEMLSSNVQPCDFLPS